MNIFNFGILGGDLRYKFLKEILVLEGHKVVSYKNEFIDFNIDSLEKFLDNSKIIIAPIPFTKDNKTIFLNNENIDIEDFFKKLNKNKITTIISGVISKDIETLANKYNIKIFDFFKYESVAVLNAIPTAEGAIQIAMEKSSRTLFGSNCLVLGYGRCGKILANSLKGLNAKVFVSYRKETDSAYIKAFGHIPVPLCEINKFTSPIDFVFNTIPSLIVDKNFLQNVSQNCLIIDLAQAPGGVDFNFARKKNIQAFYCPGLPGRVAPTTSAEILKDIILKIAISQTSNF